MSTSSIFRPSEAVLITTPKCTDHRDGVVTVEAERCETVDLNGAKNQQSSNPLIRFLESSFGAEAPRKPQMQELDELASSVKLVPACNRETVGVFDICREYSYS